MSKTKTSFKGIIFFLLILGVIAGVVCAIVFWPKRPGEIKGAVNVHANTIFEVENENSLTYNIDQYRRYAASYFEDTENQDEKRQFASNDKILISLEEYFNYLTYTMEFADFSTYDQIDISKAQENLSKAKNKANDVIEFLKDKNKNLTKPSGDSRVYEKPDAELVWMNIKTLLGEMITCYQKATTYISNIYAKNVVKGVYSNDFAKNVVKGVSYYLNYLSNNYNKLGTTVYYNMCENFNVFVKNYLGNGVNGRLIGKYYSSKTLINNTTVINNFDSKVKIYTLENFVMDGLKYDATKIDSQVLGYYVAADLFYTGGFAIWKN